MVLDYEDEHDQEIFDDEEESDYNSRLEKETKIGISDKENLNFSQNHQSKPCYIIYRHHSDTLGVL